MGLALDKFLKEVKHDNFYLELEDSRFKVDTSITAFLEFLSWQQQHSKATITETIMQILSIGLGKDEAVSIMNNKRTTLTLLIHAVSYIVAEWRQVPFAEILELFSMEFNDDNNKSPNT